MNTAYDSYSIQGKDLDARGCEKLLLAIINSAIKPRNMIKDRYRKKDGKFVKGESRRSYRTYLMGKIRFAESDLVEQFCDIFDYDLGTVKKAIIKNNNEALRKEGL